MGRAAVCAVVIKQSPANQIGGALLFGALNIGDYSAGSSPMLTLIWTPTISTPMAPATPSATTPPGAR